MCMDPINEMIYIFVGWNGEKSLDDLWVYNVKEDKWRVLSPSTTQENNAPGARSCHKMVFDSKSGSIYLLGRLADGDFPSMADKSETVVNSPPVNTTTVPGGNASSTSLTFASRSGCVEPEK